MERNLISIVVPCYNEEKAIPFFLEEIRKTTSEMIEKYDVDFEFLFVDDGSRDKTAALLRTYAKENTDVKYVIFSRNFGKEAAMYAGFCNASGDYVAVMDADLQDPPTLLPQMLQILQSEEYDSVATRRITRNHEPWIRSFFAKRFYQLINKISDADIVDGARDFRLMKRDMVDAIVKMEEYNRFSKGIFGWVGFRTYWLPYENVERVAGETKWNFWKLVKYGIDGIINFSSMPLSIASWLGMLMTVISFFALMFIIVRKLIWGDPVDGWASQVCIMIFIGGIQLFCVGVMGQYIAKTYQEVKHRPHYIISETNKEEVEKIK